MKFQPQSPTGEHSSAQPVPQRHGARRAMGYGRWLGLIGVLKLLKGLFFIAMGFALLRMLHHDVYLMALQAVQVLHLDPDRLLIASLLEKATLISDHRLKQLSVLVFLYAGLDFVEGIGLLLEKRWAEYLTLILTVALLPLEVFKLIRNPNPWIVLLLAINVVIALYLAWEVRPSQRQARFEAQQ